MASSLLHFDPNPLLTTLCAILLLLVSYILSTKWLPPRRKVVTAPEAHGGWPIFGHLALLKGPEPAFKTLGAMADRYGPVFSIRVGSHPGLVVSSAELAKECFTTNDLALASRPEMIAGEHFGFGNAMFSFEPYGPFWRELRKVATLELLSNRRLERLKHVQASEVASFVKEIYGRSTKKTERDSGSGPVSVEMKQRLSDMSLNIILQMVAGKRYSYGACDDASEARLVQKAIKEFFVLVGLFVPGDAVPWLRWLDLGGYEKAMKKAAKELDGFLSGWLEEHKRKRSEDQRSEKERDFMDVMLNVIDGNLDLAAYDADTVNKATVLNLIAAGTDTTAVTLTWAVSLLLNNRHVLKKAEDELDRHVGKARLVDESDVAKLEYLDAIIKETLRLYPPSPLSAPHVFRSDCTIGGFHVARGTRLLTNIWKIQKDPASWPDPMEFRPERFLTTHKGVDVRGHHFELIPFGSGRRACPGTSFALQTARFTLARFLQAFEISTPSNIAVDMSGSFGLTNVKATPLELLISPRLPAELYE